MKEKRIRRVRETLRVDEGTELDDGHRTSSVISVWSRVRVVVENKMYCVDRCLHLKDVVGLKRKRS